MDEIIDDSLARKRRKPRKVDSTDSIGSRAEALSKSPKDVLALGQAIVRELELDERGALLERWLAHHLAELLTEADHAVGPAKTMAEQQAVDTILKLWMHRRALPEPLDPLGGYREAIAVLGRLMPEADPWKRFHRGGRYEDLLHEIFGVLTRVVIGGVMLTHVTRIRPISEAESKAIEEEEAFLMETLQPWIPFVDSPRPAPKEVIKNLAPDSVEDVEAESESSERGPGDLTQTEQAEATEASIHSAIVENLELLQTALDELLTQWKSAADDRSGLDEDEGGDAGSDDDWETD